MLSYLEGVRVNFSTPMLSYVTVVKESSSGVERSTAAMGIEILKGLKTPNFLETLFTIGSILL